MTDLTPADLVAHIRDVAALHPGDSLIVRVGTDSATLTEAYARAITKWFDDHGSDNHVLLIGGAVEETVVARRDGH